ncbi:MAG: hypothetical protein GEV28_25240 [Actinophytocola sp.]|uniref:hypothetical protein n=1 Tax=Actinophytocola sp. TaxID=1872138 RepID=UPI001327BFB4|nr:hypothetical protein [Actinophytocola sp.]MPZ83517.1 hypothetical protein [Actinophytocola sp.]
MDYWYHAISARSLLQRFEEPPDRFASLVAASDLPMVMVCEGAESRVAAWRNLVDGSRTREKEFLV